MGELQTVEVAKVYPTEVWADKDIMGTVTVYMQGAHPIGRSAFQLPT